MMAVQQTMLVHSLVTFNISDQWTRTRVQHNESRRVLGALLGTQAGRNVEIFNTFEVQISTAENGLITIDEVYFTARETLYKETFPLLEFLGFYIVGDHTETDEQDAAVQRQALKFNESPFLLKLNPLSPVIHDKLSLSVFDSVVDPLDESRLIFHPINVKIVSELAEQIGLDHVARFSKSGTQTESVAAKHLSAQLGAISTLVQKLKLAEDYCKAVKEGKLEGNDEILASINKLCKKLTTKKSNELAETEMQQANDIKAMLLLTSMVNTEGAMFNLVTKLNSVALERQYGRSIHPTKKMHHLFGRASFMSRVMNNFS